MGKAIGLVCAVVALSACAGGSMPTAPTTSTTPAVDLCVPQTFQCLIDAASVEPRVDGLIVAPGSTATVTAGSTYALSVDYTRAGPGSAWLGVLLVRDDGMERLHSCFGGGGGGAGGGGFNTSSIISATDAMFARGRTVRMSIVGMFGSPPIPGQGCPLRTSTGELNHAVVEGQRHVVTFSIQ